jgi:4-amino-4-deoxy-L-arabinose transferase-like glycosyltransferase
VSSTTSDKSDPVVISSRLSKQQKLLFALLVVGTGILYFWNLSVNSWANAFYSAAAQAGSKNWEAFFYGSFDAANGITVDKIPASLWPMELSIRIFGFNSFSILAPQVLMGIASVILLFFLIRKRFGFWAGWTSGLVFALTPVAALMFRFNNPDAMLALFMIGAIGATLRLNDTGNKRWALLIGFFIGFAFLVKMLQAFLILPALAIPYLLFGRPKLGKRLIHLVLALVALIVSAGWWIAIVELTPASARPYIGGSQHNSILELTLGYNGLGRLNGKEVGSVTSKELSETWGKTGLGRLFLTDIGGQISWLLPLALFAIILGVLIHWRSRGTDGKFFSTTVWGFSLVVTGLTFSLMQGIFHQYYTVALVPYIAALVGIFVGTVIQNYKKWQVRVLAAVAVLGSGIWAGVLLDRNVDLGWLKLLTFDLGIIGALLILASYLNKRWIKNLAAVVPAVALLAGPLYYTLYTVNTSYTGSVVIAGPSVTGTRVNISGGASRFCYTAYCFANAPLSEMGNLPGVVGSGNLLDATMPSARVQKLLSANSGSYKWIAATVGSQNAAGYQIATQLPVMTIGGFNGTDPYPTLSQFKQMVANGQIHYYIDSGYRTDIDEGENIAIGAWIKLHYTAKLVDGVILYDLTSVN